MEGYGQFQVGGEGYVKAKWFKINFDVIITWKGLQCGLYEWEYSNLPCGRGWYFMEQHITIMLKNVNLSAAQAGSLLSSQLDISAW